MNDASATNESDNGIPSPEVVYATYLADSATDKKGKKYIFNYNGDNWPDHQALVECVLGDIDNGGDRYNDDPDFAEAVEDACNAAMARFEREQNGDEA